MNRWQDVLELDVQVAIYAGDAGLWDQAKWTDVAKWAGTQTGDGLMWTSIFDRVIAISTQRGRGSMFESPDTGTAQIDVVNDDGWASGRKIDAGMAALVPYRQIRVMARPAGSYATDTWYPIWTGFVDDVSAPWRTAQTSNATIRCVDGLARLSMVDPAKTTVPRETLEARINRICNMAGWTGGRDFHWGTNPIVQGGVLDTNLLTEAQVAAYSCRQYLFADLNGTLRLGMLPGTSDAIHAYYHLSNAASAGNTEGTWCPNLPIPWPGAATTGIRNRIELSAPPGLAVHTYNNPTSQAAYGIRPWGRSDLITDSVAALDDIGNDIVAHDAWPRLGHVTYSIDLPSGIRLGPALNLARVTIEDQFDTDLTIDPVDGPPWKAGGSGVWVMSVEHSITETTWTVQITVDQRAGIQPTTATQPDRAEELAWH